MSVPRWLTQPLFDPAVEPTSSTLRQNQANPKKKSRFCHNRNVVVVLVCRF